MILLFAVTALIVLNSANIRRECDEMISLAESGDHRALQEKWDSVRSYFGAFIRDTEIDNADLKIRELVGASESGDEKEISSRLTEVVDALIEIRDCETPTLTGIFSVSLPFPVDKPTV